MSESLPSELIIAIATILATFITGAFALVNMTLSKESKVSDLRQAWIDGIRNDLSIFFSGARFLAGALADDRDRVDHNAETGELMPLEIVADRTIESQEAFYRIKLRLNAQESEHLELERLLESIIATWNRERVPDSKMPYEEMILAIDRAVKYSQSILKKEWERVKEGEKSYTTLKKILTPIAIILCSVLVGLIFWVT